MESSSDSSDLGNDTDDTGPLSHAPNGRDGPVLTAFTEKASRRRARAKRKQAGGLPDGQLSAAESGLGGLGGAGDVPVRRGVRASADHLEPVLERTPQ